MAVRHGYGKIAGTDALVFAYDTGDTVNSYKGEPTENIVTNPTFLGTSGTQTTAVSKNWEFSGDSSAAGFNFYNSSTSPIPLKFPNEGAVITTGPNESTNRRIYYTGAVEPNTTYTLSYWVYSSAANSISNYFFIYQADNSNAGSTSIGYPITAGEWVYVEQSFTTTSTTSNTRSVNWGPVISLTSDTLIAMQRFQIEVKDHATPFVNGTRSATEGLKDLTGNSSIDLSNAGFDSNAQIDLDGTDDEITTPDSTLLDLTTEMSFEFVFNADSSQSNLYPRLIDKSATWLVHILQTPPFGYFQNIYTSAGLRQVGTTVSTIQADTWNHVMSTYDGQVGSIYLNRELIRTLDFGSVLPCTVNNTVVTIGGDTGTSRQFNGNIAITKIYNRALTAAEVKSNYSHYKTRFGI